MNEKQKAKIIIKTLNKIYPKAPVPLKSKNIFTLLMLVALQAVLGFDNLLYISLESKRAPKEKQSYVRKVGILLAIAFRIILLIVLLQVIELFQDPIFGFDFEDVLVSNFNIHSLIVLGGGIFIIYTAMKEIWHMIAIHDVAHNVENGSKSSVSKVITMIVIMNVVFSFDSILSYVLFNAFNFSYFLSYLFFILVIFLFIIFFMIW